MLFLLKKNIFRIIQHVYLIFFEILILVPLFILCFLSKFFYKKYTFGIGPEPLINNIAFKKALDKINVNSITFATHLYYVTSSFDKIFYPFKIRKFIIFPTSIKAFIFSIFRCRNLIIYFNGGSLFNTIFLRFFEPYFYKLAKIKIIVMPYGGDVQDLSRSPNLLFKNACNESYSNFKYRKKLIERNIDRWTNNADFVIGGCEWVDYMYGWDMLLPAHFTVEIPSIINFSDYKPNTKLRILHAPNHRQIKGTNYIIKTIKKLKNQFKLDIELILKEKEDNATILKSIQECDLVIDQLIIGWYGLFSLEAMAYGKPVLCFLRNDLVDLYTYNKIIDKEDFEKNESNIISEVFPPIINSDIFNLEKTLLEIYYGKINLNLFSHGGHRYCKKYHSVNAMSERFQEIIKKLNQ
tara:strand:+ start:14190 stop:15416 length:1227 start_codon:yes stop_codon:yes gene_type:complete